MHNPKTKENKERESGHMNSTGEIWKQTESQRGTHIKAGIPHETNMKKGKERNNMRQNKRRTPKKQNISWTNCFVGSMENKLGTMNLGISCREQT